MAVRAEPAASTTTSWAALRVGSCVASAALLLIWAWFSSSGGWAQCAAVWVALSLLTGPFAPPSATAGPCSVGVGPTIPSPTPTPSPPPPHLGRRRQADALVTRPPSSPEERIQEEGEGEDDNDDDGSGSAESARTDDDHDNKDLDEYINFWLHDDDADHKPSSKKKHSSPSYPASQPSEASWDPQDSDLLKKLMLKHPHGKLGRWEIIAEAFQGKHSVELIIKMAKNLGSKDDGDDSYAQFLAKRKMSEREISSPLTQRWDGDRSVPSNEENAAETQCSDANIALNQAGKGRKDWTEVEDKSLLNALKAFPKDIPMRWDKVASAVPGKTKQQCFRRYAELRDGFRSKQLEKSNNTVSD